MIAELAHYAFIICLVLASYQIFITSYALYQNQDQYLSLSRPLSYGQCFFCLLAYLGLTYAFIHNDFSLQYVANHSNSCLPWFYKISAVWGAHEGSVLLWALILQAWMSYFAIKSKALPERFMALSLTILSMVGLGLGIFILAASNPFLRLEHAGIPLDGADLNPLLQDFGLIIHPPILYLGYIGFALPFALALAGLILKTFDSSVYQFIRKSNLLAWAYLSLGIVLGSWWAYYELGWGGWWFWDPVENASFMPWLSAVALIHCLKLSEKKGQFQVLTVFLCLLSFALSLLGTFLVRSGLLSSVHSFALDPKRGFFILQYLLWVIGSAFAIFAWQARHLLPSKKLKIWSREAFLLVCTLLFLISTGTILIGTLFPLIIEAGFNHKISVGYPYFNSVFIPIMVPTLILMPLGPLLAWSSKQQQYLKVLQSLPYQVILSLAATLVIMLISAEPFNFKTGLGLSLFNWILILSTKNWLLQGKINRYFLAMTLAHVGMAVTTLGITFSANFSIEKELSIGIGEKLNLAHYELSYKAMEKIEGENYVSYKARFALSKNGEWQSNLYPEKRFFLMHQLPMSETAIDWGIFRDVYIALGEQLSNQRWSVRAYYKPFVRWIWFGGGMMALAGFIAGTKRNKAE